MYTPYYVQLNFDLGSTETILNKNVDDDLVVGPPTALLRIMHVLSYRQARPCVKGSQLGMMSIVQSTYMCSVSAYEAD